MSWVYNGVLGAMPRKPGWRREAPLSMPRKYDNRRIISSQVSRPSPYWKGARNLISGFGGTIEDLQAAVDSTYVIAGAALKEYKDAVAALNILTGTTGITTQTAAVDGMGWGFGDAATDQQIATAQARVDTALIAKNNAMAAYNAAKNALASYQRTANSPQSSQAQDANSQPSEPAETLAQPAGAIGDIGNVVKYIVIGGVALVLVTGILKVVNKKEGIMISRSDYISGNVEEDVGQGYRIKNTQSTPAEDTVQTNKPPETQVPVNPPKKISMQNIVAIALVAYLGWYFFIRKD